MPRKSIGEYVANFLQRGRECAYVQHRGYRIVRWTYADVANAALSFVEQLGARGISKGDRVLIWGPNSAEWVSAFFACAVSGVVAVPLDDVSTPDFAQKVCQSVNAKLLICSREHSNLGVAGKPFLLDNLRERLAARVSGVTAPNNVGINDPLEIVFTSGTTAEPKGVVITHGNVLANVEPLEMEIGKYIKYERLVHPVRFLNLLPLSHMFGQFMGMFLPHLMGGTVVFQDTLKPSEILNIIRQERVSVLVTVPRILQSLKEKIERDTAVQDNALEFQRKFKAAQNRHFLKRWWTFRRIHKLFGWKFWAFICGGATLDADTETFWNRLGYAAIQGYGLTETTSLISLNHPFRPGKGSIGKVMPGREVKLSPEGEIMVRGGSVAANYWQGQQLRQVASDEGWYRTGDLGEVDSQGNLHFKGRVKDVIVTPAGMKVYPDDLEAALRLQPEVRDCVVIGLPVEGNAEPCAVLILRNASENVADIVDRANQSLAEFQRMRKWHVWRDEDFPRTTTLKPRKNVIRDKVLANRTQNAGSSTCLALAEIVERISGRAAESPLTSDSALDADLNLSSLDRVALTSALEDRYGVDLEDFGLASLKTIGDVEQLLRKESTPRISYHFPDWVQQWPVTWIRTIAQYLFLRPAVFLLARPRVRGSGILSDLRGPVLVICNHITDVDFALVLAALPARVGNRLAIATAGEELEALRKPSAKGLFARFCSRARWFLGVSLLNLFPLPRQAGFRQSFAYAGKSVDRGFSILVFPEGAHTTDGKLRKFRAGIGLLANNLQIPVVPVRIHGLFEIKQSGKKFASPGRIEIRIGDPVIFRDQKPELIAEKLQGIMERL